MSYRHCIPPEKGLEPYLLNSAALAHLSYSGMCYSPVIIFTPTLIYCARFIASCFSVSIKYSLTSSRLDISLIRWICLLMSITTNGFILSKENAPFYLQYRPHSTQAFRTETGLVMPYSAALLIDTSRDVPSVP